MCNEWAVEVFARDLFLENKNDKFINTGIRPDYYKFMCLRKNSSEVSPRHWPENRISKSYLWL